jgi:hypothetical protein
MVFKRGVLAKLMAFLGELAQWHGGRGYPWWRFILDEIDTAVVSSFSEYVLYFSFARALFPETVRLRDLTEYDGDGQHWEIFWFADATGRSPNTATAQCFLNGDPTRLRAEASRNYCTPLKPPKRRLWRSLPTPKKKGGAPSRRGTAPAACPFPYFTAYHHYKLAKGGPEEQQWAKVSSLFEDMDAKWWKSHDG